MCNPFVDFFGVSSLWVWMRLRSRLYRRHIPDAQFIMTLRGVRSSARADGSHPCAEQAPFNQSACVILESIDVHFAELGESLQTLGFIGHKPRFLTRMS